MSLIYGEYLVNVHFSDIPHTFIPHFTLHSAEKNPLRIFRKLPVDNFPHSAVRIPQNTPSRRSSAAVAQVAEAAAVARSVVHVAVVCCVSCVLLLVLSFWDIPFPSHSPSFCIRL